MTSTDAPLYHTKIQYTTNSRGERATFVQQTPYNQPYGETPLLSSFPGVLSESEAIQRLINIRQRAKHAETQRNK